MIIDRIQPSGLDAYFQDPAHPGIVNLGRSVPTSITRTYPLTVRTAPLNKGKQLEISDLRLLIEGDDLGPLFRFQQGANGSITLFRISVMKEMFAGLFADPFRHRVYNIAGYADFKRGKLTNGTIQEVDGIPTICSNGREECTWQCEYVLPESIDIDSVAWELATSKLSPPNSFKYKIDINCLRPDGTGDTISTGTDFINAAVPRFKEKIIHNVNRLNISFRALVNQDSFVTERQLPGNNEKTGRPLLRAINILELLKSSIYDIHSLTELKSLCSEFEISETTAPAIKRVHATLDINAVLVNSENQGNDFYEFIKLELLTNQFNTFEAKKSSEVLLRLMK